MMDQKFEFWNDSTPLRISAGRTFYNGFEYTGLDLERVKMYAKVNGIDLSLTPINAKLMNEMEEWYFSLALKELNKKENK